MIRVGQREFEVALWLWVAVPLASVIYAVYGTDVFLPRFGVPDEAFFLTVRRCATAALAGFLIADLSRAGAPAVVRPDRTGAGKLCSSVAFD